MKPEDVRDLYSREYAARYDEKFLGGGQFDRRAKYQLEVLQRLMDRSDRWLDLGCGTGWVASRFPDVERTLMDLSPAMIEHASRTNPSATCVEGSFLDEHPEWHGRFGVVSAMWAPYAYLDDLQQVGRLVANMAQWVSAGGVVFLPVVDAEDLYPGLVIPYGQTKVFEEPVFVTMVRWSWTDPAGKDHDDLIAPQLGKWLELFGRYFETLVVERWPAGPNGHRPKAIVASGKRPFPIAANPHQTYIDRFPSGEPADESRRAHASLLRRIWSPVPVPAKNMVRRGLAQLPDAVTAWLQARR